MLNHLRYWKPTSQIFHKLQHERLLCRQPSISDAHLLDIIQNNAYSTFITVSRNAVLRINRLVLENFFLPTCSSELFKWTMMSLLRIFTRECALSLPKIETNGVVNGQPAMVVMMKGFTVVLQLPNSKKVSVHPVTTMNNESQCVTMFASITQ